MGDYRLELSERIVVGWRIAGGEHCSLLIALIGMSRMEQTRITDDKVARLDWNLPLVFGLL